MKNVKIIKRSCSVYTRNKWGGTANFISGECRKHWQCVCWLVDLHHISCVYMCLFYLLAHTMFGNFCSSFSLLISYLFSVFSYFSVSWIMHCQDAPNQMCDSFVFLSWPALEEWKFFFFFIGNMTQTYNHILATMNTIRLWDGILS